MGSNHLFYSRRAAEEKTRAARAVSPEARDWHLQLSLSFARQAQDQLSASGG